MSGRKQFEMHLVERGEHGIIEKQDEAALTAEGMLSDRLVDSSRALGRSG